MKKILSVILLSFLILGLCACGSGGDAANKDKPLTSEQIVQKLKDDYSLPITQELTYTEETDSNGLLGRPDQYTSKTSWNDENDVDEVQMCNDYPNDDYRDCTVEVFENKSDARERQEYIESVWEDGGLLHQDQYIYRAGTALLRVTYQITPDQAAAYEKAFYEIMGVDSGK